jgi:hypothetical protein
MDFGVGECPHSAQTFGKQDGSADACYFSKASWVDDYLIEMIQPPSLRTPEVVLVIPWDNKVDVCSAACTVGCAFHST